MGAAVHLVVAKVESDPEVEIFTLGGKRLRSSSLWKGRIGGMAASRRTKSCRQVFPSAGFGSPPMRETRPRTVLST